MRAAVPKDFSYSQENFGNMENVACHETGYFQTLLSKQQQTTLQ